MTHKQERLIWPSSVAKATCPFSEVHDLRAYATSLQTPMRFLITLDLDGVGDCKSEQWTWYTKSFSRARNHVHTSVSTWRAIASPSIISFTHPDCCCQHPLLRTWECSVQDLAAFQTISSCACSQAHVCCKYTLSFWRIWLFGAALCCLGSVCLAPEFVICDVLDIC